MAESLASSVGVLPACRSTAVPGCRGWCGNGAVAAAGGAVGTLLGF